MFIREIFDEKYANHKEMYGLEVDEESTKTKYSARPHKFDTIGIKVECEDGMLTDAVQNIAIAYSMKQISILYEMPTQYLVEGKMNIRTLKQIIQNGKYMLSLLPPRHPFVNNTITFEQYLDVIKQFFTEMNQSKIRFEEFVVPISNFLEYLMLERLLGKDNPAVVNFRPDNPYILEHFLPYLTPEEIDSFKDVLRQALYDYYGKEEFELITSIIFDSIYNRSQRLFTQSVQEFVYQDKIKYLAEHPDVDPATVWGNQSSTISEDTSQKT